jgi:hypothetical protein
MNAQLLFFLIVVAGLLGVLVWALRGAPPARQALPPQASLEELGPSHCKYFAQIRQAFSPEDWEFVRRRASPKLLRRMRAERNRVARLYVRGLREDFARLNRLARIVASLSPQVDHRREWDRLGLYCRFELLSLLVALRLRIGGRATAELGRLTNVVGSFASRMEAAVLGLSEISTRPAAAR